MTADLIISYDGTPNDDDALALGKLLAHAGSSVALAYVRHAREFDHRREELALYDAEQRLERGAALIGIPVTQHVVVGAATGAVLGGLAEQLDAAIIVFGSDYRTPLGRAEPGTSA
ncbi:MAG: universal stress protein, partial [Acidobacteriota bacterium]|nr:universal stress protein [Acidobacteriota bacterium]